MLTPILISGSGRSGTTLLMSLTGSDSRVVFDREFPFEHRYLTRFAKFGLFFERQDVFNHLADGDELCDFDYLGFGGRPPVLVRPSPAPGTYLPLPSTSDWIRTLWERFSLRVRDSRPASLFYSEKVPVWLPPVVRPALSCYTIHLFRDPRDVYLSANAFMKKRNYTAFGRTPGDSDLDHARRLSLEFLNHYVNYRADANRADCLTVRYEDLVCERERALAPLQQTIGLELDLNAGAEYLEIHSTAANLAQSVRRWQREPIPRAVSRFFDRYLREEMADLGYTDPVLAAPPRFRSLEFSRGDSDPSAMPHSADGKLERDRCCALATMNGPDFWFVLPFDPFNAAEVKEVWVCVQSAVGEVFSLYWRGPGAGFSETNSIHVPFQPSTHWQIVRFQAGRNPRWKGKIAEIRLDPFNSARHSIHGAGLIRWVRLIE